MEKRDDRPAPRVTPGAPEETEAVALDLDDHVDLEAATRDALAAVEHVHQDHGVQQAAAAETAAELERLQAELSEVRSRAARTLADFENFRKRSERDREDQRRYAVVEPFRDVVAVVDNLERALSIGATGEDLRRGVEMILRQVRDVLRHHHVREIEAEGRPFDPSVHEAVAREEDPSVSSPVVKDVLQRGYQLHDRLLRPAMVRVAVPVAGNGATTAERSQEN